MTANQPKSTLLANLAGGLALGFTEVVFCLSIGSLIFSGPLKAALPRGVAIALVTTIIHILWTTFASRTKPMISGLEDTTSVLLAVSAASVAASIGLQGPLLPTIVALLLTATLLTGFFLLILGYFRLGDLVRYIPYPVIGGFVAGSGWLLLRGSIGAMADYPLEMPYFSHLMQTDQVIQWLPGVAFGLFLFIGVKRVHHYLALPGLLVSGFVIFYLGLLLTGTTIPAAVERGLLLGPVGNAVWQVYPADELWRADWGAVLGQAGNIGAIVMITAVEMLLNISSLELALRQDIDLNRELRVAGWGNIFSTLAGGTIGFHSLSSTLMSYRMHARGWLVGSIIGAICLLTLVGGAAFLAYVPKPLLGGLLFYLGLDFIYEWLIEGRRKLNRAEYGVVLLIVVIVAAAGFLIGVAVGLALMVALFVINYSRLNLFYRTTSGAEVSSHVDRSPATRRALETLGQEIFVLQLQGFLFFGTANTVLQRVRQRISTPGAKSLAFLILDFRRVTGLDSSAIFSLTKLKHLAESEPFILVFTHLSDEIRSELAESELIKVFPDLDHGMEWCEDILLKGDKVTKKHIPATIELQLAESGFKTENTRRLKPYLAQIILNQGDYLMRQGDPSSDLYFIEVGRVSIYLELGSGKRVRVRSFNKGSVVGELGFLLDSQRSASVIAETKALAYRLTRKAMDEMREQDADLATAFNELMLQLIAERLVATDRELEALNQ